MEIDMKKGRNQIGLLLLLLQTVILTSCNSQDFRRQWSQQEEIVKLQQEETLQIESNTNQNKPSIESSTEQTQESVQASEVQEGELEYSFTDEYSNKYAYNTLSETEKIWYRGINRILGQMQEKQELSSTGLEEGLDETNIEHIFQCVLNDHPEYFYVDGYTYTVYSFGDRKMKIDFTGTYNRDLEGAKEGQAFIREIVQKMVAGIDENASEYEKVKYVYDTLILSTEYNLNASDNQNIYSVFVNRSSVCQGYAKASQYLLSHLGVEATLVIGQVHTGESHAWNLVKIDGEYYYMDATWGDASYLMDEEDTSNIDSSLPDINYDYLCVTTDQIMRTHMIQSEVPMPICNAIDANYYVQEETFLTNVDAEVLRQIFTKAKENGKEQVTFMCADNGIYQDVNRYLIDEQHIFDYLDGSDGTVAYSQNQMQLSMTFWLATRE